MAIIAGLPELHHSDEMFLSELEQDAACLLDRHESSPRFFVPAEIDDALVDAIKKGDYTPHTEIIPPAVLNALIVNVLTEDGLPYYTSTLIGKAPKGHPFREWVHRWTAEEGRHSPAIMAFIHRTGQIDMTELENARMATNSNPDTPQPESFVEGLVYTAIQEPATEVSHRNTVKQLPDGHRKFGSKAISPVIGDEVKHGNFYGDMSEAALRANPSLTIIGIARQIKTFGMPGQAIPDFEERAKTIAAAGIFGPKQLKQIYDKLFAERWPIWDLPNLTPEAERAREIIAKKLGQLTLLIQRMESA